MRLGYRMLKTLMVAYAESSREDEGLEIGLQRLSPPPPCKHRVRLKFMKEFTNSQGKVKIYYITNIIFWLGSLKEKNRF